MKLFALSQPSTRVIRQIPVSISPPAAIPILNEDWETSEGDALVYDVGEDLRIVTTTYDLLFNTTRAFGGDAANPKRFRISWEVASVDGAECWLYVFERAESNFDFVKEDGVTAIYEALVPGQARSVIYDEAVNTTYSGYPPSQARIMIECDDATQIDFVGGFTIEEVP